MTTAATSVRPSETVTFDIEHASKASGLSAGVLRMWELRYGWPRPARLPNGYRVFTAYQIEDLKRMSALVKSGMLIGKLIDAGMPKWPNDGTVKPKQAACLLEAARGLPQPRSAQARDIRDRLIDALKIQNHGKTWELLLRATWEIHPNEQALAAWLPCVVAMDEFADAGKPLPKREDIEAFVIQHVRGALGRLPPNDRPLWIVPTSAADTCTAYVAALVLSQQGRDARPWQWEKLPTAPFMTVGKQADPARFPAERNQGHLAVVASAKQQGLTGLVATVGAPIPR
ncbi:MAG: MerR family transcriptional regulator [Planctomycetes bacterium]|nr:MerR family transcriptional regulator [Planctomycetota bacterium]